MGNERSDNPLPRFSTRLVLSGALVIGGCLALGCRTTEKDVQRWANTAQGPSRLVAVVTHDKYAESLRVEAAVTLIGMRPRSGQRIGITLLLDALEHLPKDARSQVMQGLVPRLTAMIQKPPVREGDQRIDESVPFKDAAYALLTSPGGSLVDDAESAERLKHALATWAYTDFDQRVDDPSQAYGVEQMMRWLGPDGVRGLPELLTPDADKVDRIVALVAEIGDAETKSRTSERLVHRARHVGSPAWIRQQEPMARDQNAKAKLKPTPEQFEKQLTAYQEEQLLRLYPLMKRIGKRPVVGYLLEEAENTKLEEKRRATALAALEGHIDARDTEQVQRLLNLAGAEDVPDAVRDVALRRVGELPREKVIDRLYALFASQNWKVRWVAAELVLQMSTQEHLGEFMAQLGRVKHMAITEPLRYGALLKELKGKRAPDELARTYAGPRQPTPVRVSALGYFYEYGTPTDLDALAPFAGDRERVPTCARDAADCEWKCAAEGELKEIQTVGEFVEYCLRPAMQKRTETKTEGNPSNTQR
jgi:hypothetical protein